MKGRYFLFTALLLSLAACEQRNAKSTVDVDNTGRNVRDREATITPGDQAENENDRKIVREIRKTIVGDNSLSSNAKNVKIISINKVVTLRGVVDNNQEKDAIEKIARATSDVSRVDNQLEVKGRE